MLATGSVVRLRALRLRGAYGAAPLRANGPCGADPHRANGSSRLLPAVAAVAAAALAIAGCAGETDLAGLDLEGLAGACAEAPPLLLPGESRGLVVVNAYYLQEEATRALRRGEATAAAVEEVLSEAAAMGAAAVRTDAFNDDPAKAGDSAMQLAPLVYDEVALRGMDLVLARARAHGVRLVLPLGNFWSAYGGAEQYVAWAGLPAPREGDPRFFSDRRVVENYRAHVTALLSRVSSVDGVRWGEHPAVLAWELLNEPRPGPAPWDRAALEAWVRELAALVKSLAPGHLVGTGEEGLDLDLLVANASAPDVDYASVHLYPEGPGVFGAGAAWYGAKLLDVRLRAAPRSASRSSSASSGSATTARSTSARAATSTAAGSSACGGAAARRPASGCSRTTAGPTRGTRTGSSGGTGRPPRTPRTRTWTCCATPRPRGERSGAARPRTPLLSGGRARRPAGRRRQ